MKPWEMIRDVLMGMLAVVIVWSIVHKGIHLKGPSAVVQANSPEQRIPLKKASVWTRKTETRAKPSVTVTEASTATLPAQSVHRSVIVPVKPRLAKAIPSRVRHAPMGTGAGPALATTPAIPEANPPASEPYTTISEPEARQALKKVGADPDAERVWVQAINDPNLSMEARQNLIEDLNEEGFPDPKNLTAADLPLIESRIALIESPAPDAMDETNAAAFREAYKDLREMYNRITQG
jgi:hypothetical protein